MRQLAPASFALSIFVAAPALMHAQQHDARTNLHLRVMPIAAVYRGDTLRISFRLANDRASTDSLVAFHVDAPSPVLQIKVPEPSLEWAAGTDFAGRSVASWALVDQDLTPGRVTPTLTFDAVGLPGIVKFWGKPDVQPRPMEYRDLVSDDSVPPGPEALPDVVMGQMIGVVPFPANRSFAALAAHTDSMVADFCHRQWIDLHACSRLHAQLAKRDLAGMQRELRIARGAQLNDGAYFALHATTSYLQGLTR